MEEELLLDKNRNRQVKRLFSKTKGDGYGLFLGGRSGDDEREEMDVTYCAALGGAFGGELWDPKTTFLISVFFP